jgi:hypothetical protein
MGEVAHSQLILQWVAVVVKLALKAHKPVDPVAVDNLHHFQLERPVKETMVVKAVKVVTFIGPVAVVEQVPLVVMDQIQLAAMVELVQFGFLHLQQLSQLRCLWHKPDKLRVIKSILLEAGVAQLQEEQHQQQVVVV